jgi:hypothetical protein
LGEETLTVTKSTSRILVGADVDADDSGPSCPGAQPGGHHREPFAVEAVAVDHGAVRREAEHPRLRVARLRPRHDPADLDEAEAEAEQRVGHTGALVEAGREANRIWEAAAEQVDREAGIVRAPAAGRQQGERPQRQVMGALGIEAVEQRPDQGKGDVDHAGRSPAGKTWRPSAPRGSASTERTASSGSAP